MFRPEVIEARKERLHGDVSLAVPVSWQAVGYLLLAALAVAIVFLATATYSRVETVSGSIVVDKGTAQIVPTRTGVIAELLIREGQQVAAGQPLAHIRAEEDLASGGTAPQRVIEALDRQARQLGDQATMILNAAAAEQSRLSAAIAGARREVSSLDQQISDQRQLMILAKNDLRLVQGIADRGFISRRDLNTREATLLGRRQQLSQLQQQRTAKLTAIADSQRALAQADANARAQSVAVEAQRTGLAQQIAQFDAAKGYTVTAPVAGKITALTARPGQPVAQGQALMMIVPSGGRTRVELYVPTNAAGFLRKGQEVRLAVDAFPYQQFGTVPARIGDIATATTLRPAPNGASVPVYLVTAQLERTSVNAFGRQQPLLPGMTLSARIVTRRQSLFEWLFEPLFAVGRR